MSKILSLAIIGGAALTAVLGVPTLAKASPLPPMDSAIWGFGSGVFVGSVGTDFAGATTFTDRIVTTALGSAEVQSAATPVPTITASVSGVNFNTGALALGNLFYYARVIGPGGIVPVNLNVDANAALFSMAPNALFGSFSRDQLDVNGISLIDKVSDQGANTGAFSVSATISVFANQEFQVHMIARALTQDSSVSASAFIDPLFSLDPSLVALGYSIQTSPGIGNSIGNATPLPAAAPLFAAGLGVIGLLARRRKRMTTTVIAVA